MTARSLDRRPRATLVNWLLALPLLALASCSKQDAPAEQTQATRAPLAPAAGAPLKIAFMYVGPVGDAGWTFAHDLGRKAVEEKYGAKVRTSFVESVPESSDAERVLRDLIDQGNQLIFGTTFGYMETFQK